MNLILLLAAVGLGVLAIVSKTLRIVVTLAGLAALCLLASVTVPLVTAIAHHL